MDAGAHAAAMVLASWLLLPDRFWLFLEGSVAT
jgi:hypothetical protein